MKITVLNANQFNNSRDKEKKFEIMILIKSKKLIIKKQKNKREII